MLLKNFSLFAAVLMLTTVSLADDESSAVTLSLTDADEVSHTEEGDEADWLIEAALLQPQPLVLPSLEVAPETASPSSASNVAATIFGSNRLAIQQLPTSRRRLATKPSADVIFGTDAGPRVSTDTGSLLGKSPAALGIGIQRRTPVVAEPRIRGGRIGSLSASGSHWVPARLDLDTMVSKLDSRIVSDIVVINGPFSVLHGPGFGFVDVELLRSPRYYDGLETHGSTAADYKTNGEQFYGRQEVWGGDETYGFRVGYGHGTGNDYRSGSGANVPASYNSRDLDVALGRDLTDDSFIEFSYLRLDQTNVEFPGQAFDIDFLVTDAYEVEYVRVDQPHYDRLSVDAWYNRTRFEGSAQRPSKRAQFPFYDFISFVGNTDVDSLSTGMRADLTWGNEIEGELTAGVDFRYVKQELNEISSGRILPAIWMDANSPIPDSYSANPGLFAEYVKPVNDTTSLTLGIRGDSVGTNVTDDPAKLAALGLEDPQHSLEQILGTNAFDQSFTLWSGYVSGSHALSDTTTLSANFGYAERPPGLTELYAAQTFMFLIQNGLNTVTGDPTLSPERMYQVDVGLDVDREFFRGGARGFHAWVRDYITFEATRTFTTTQLEQVSLQFVNTDLATLAGAELYAEVDLTGWLTPFATMQYVEGRDHSRNGSFATQRATGGSSSMKVLGMTRGSFTTLGGAAQEPLPGISPLESRLGFRIHEPYDNPSWMVEMAARVVDNQDRVASSLAETPTPGFTVWDIRATWQACDSLMLIGGIENFTGKNYREHLDFRSANGIQMLQPGVSYYFGGELFY